MLQLRTLIFCLIFSNTVIAGDLDSFEQSASQPSYSNDSTSSSNSSTDCYDDDIFHIECIGYYVLRSIVEGIAEGMLYGGRTSIARVNAHAHKKFNIVLILDEKTINDTYQDNLHANTDDGNSNASASHHEVFVLPLRKLHEPQVPFFRVDASLQYIKSTVSAKDYRFLFGYGPAAFQLNQTRFTESNPTDSLTLTRLFGVYRMSFSTEYEIGIGLGKLIIEGNKKTEQFYFTVPFKFHINKIMGFEYRPAWSSTINDYDLSVFSHHKYGSVKVGYRWLSTNSQSLSGPYIGFAAFY